MTSSLPSARFVAGADVSTARTHRVGAVALAVAWLPAFVATGEPPSTRSWIDRVGDHVEVGSILELEAAIQTRDAHAQMFQLTFEFELEAELPHEAVLTGITRIRTDAIDDLEPGAPTQHAVSKLSRHYHAGPSTELELRELYVEASVGPAYLTIGKQQIVWGKSDGLKVLDVVNPQDFREFILDDFESSRIPLWTFNAELPIRDATLQVLWIPDPTYHDLAELDGTFALTTPRFTPRPPPGVPIIVRDPDRPRRLLRDSDAGFRISTFWKGSDLSLNYLYHYHDAPILFRVPPSAPAAPIVVTPGWERTHTMGGTFSRAIGDFVVRSEAAYSSDRFFSTADPTEPDGVIDTGEVAYVLGLDWYGVRESLLSFQLFQSWLLSDANGLARDPLDTNVSLLVRRNFLQTTLTLDAIGIHNINDGDGLVRLSGSYEIQDGLELEAGLDLFYGRSEGAFGQFDSRDRVTLRIRWSH